MRSLIEDELLTESGYRENLAEESLLRKLQTAGAAPGALAKLVNRRLLRIEERLDVRRVELTHDVLTGVVKASRDQRHEREARPATERLLAEQARESAARRALRRARVIAAGCTALAVVAIAAAVVAFFNVQRARSAEQLARQTRATSEQAREEAEGLLGFLTDDFVGELETFGRYQTIAELSQREIDYFQHLPPQLVDSRTLRSGALALVNHALALQFLGDVDTADTNLTQALALLEHTDQSEATAIAMGRAYTEWAFDFSAEANTAKANVAAERAVDLLRPIAHGAGASIEVRVAYLESLVELGYRDSNSDQEKAVRAEQEALQVGRSLGAPDHGTATMDADYAAAGGYLATALARLGRNAEALRASQEALAVVDHVLELHPQFGWALFGKQQATESLVSIARNELDAAGALRFAMQEEQTSLALVGVEPRNGFYVFLLGFAYTDLSHSLWNDGRLRESIAYTRKAVDAYHRVITSGLRPVSVVYQVGAMDYLVRHQTQLGDFAGAAATIGETDALLSSNANLKLGFTSGLNDRLDTANEVERTSPSANLAYERGDLAAAVENERRALKAEQPVAGGGTDDQLDKQRDEGRMGVWLSMALAREGKRQEAAQSIDPVVQLYRALAARNHGDQWLPLELAEALYAQSLTDEAHRAELLREAARRVDHLIPAIAALHDTRVWRVRIEEAQRAASGEAAPRASAPRAARATASPH